MKCTALVCGIGGIWFAESLRSSINAETIPLGPRLFWNGFSGICFALSGMYVHMFLPAILIVIVPMCLAYPDYEPNVGNEYKKADVSDAGDQ